MIEQISQQIADWIVSLGNSISTWLDQHFINIVIILVCAWIAKRVAHNLISNLLKRTVRPDLYPTKTDREKRLKTLDSLITAIVKLAVYLIAIFLIIGEVDPGLTAALFAGAGLITIAVGFGAQSLVKDFVSGFFIILENQYRVGDIVQIGGVSGTVENVTIRTTVVRDINGSIHHVPNGFIDVTTNMTLDYSRISEQIVVGFDTDIARLEHIINHVGEEMKADPAFKNKIIEPPQFAQFKGYATNGLIVTLFAKTTPGDQWSLRTEMYKRLQKAFDKAGIEVTNIPATGVHEPVKKKKTV